MRANPLLPLLTAALLGGTAPAALAQATIQIVNINAANVGFNDPTPVAPQPGNAATTLGQQRLNVFQRAAEIWGAALSSSVPIRVDAQFVAQTCTPTSGTLGSAGTLTVWRDFPNAPRAATWYPAALANKLAGTDLDPASSDIRTSFNSNVGQPGCLDSGGTPSSFYMGLDDNPPAGSIYLLPVVLHELGHGLGFQPLTSGSTGERIGEGAQRFASVWEQYMLDLSTNKLWL
ncbi:MAG: peptidase, partial [Betaproteobacteria bacterium]